MKNQSNFKGMLYNKFEIADYKVEIHQYKDGLFYYKIKLARKIVRSILNYVDYDKCVADARRTVEIAGDFYA